ncbi:MAG TPA: L-seryl-tRNA(Sec) selenium transferase [Planctomycetota bacterium]|nr:L-seryl-tRNA(Sec) selenium transferase [Planctomycetota bacterium]
MRDDASATSRWAQKEDLLRALPAVQKLLDHAPIKGLQERFGREVVVGAARETLSEIREAITTGQNHIPQNAGEPGRMLEMISGLVSVRVERRCASGVRRVINATGVILHTGLGRAVLPAAAIHDIVQELSGYASVEVDVDSGKRGHRDETLRDLVKTLLGCESATVVNNNAAATMLALAAIARGKEVIVSRGQLVEIGGSFRVPDVMRESGCKLVEVGTTNRTYVRDYDAAITPETAALLLVHTSNFRMLGFTTEPTVAEMSELARKRGLPLIHDIGSGALLPGLADELRSEPVVKTALDDGADLVLFSADKILGSAQGGIAAGRKDLVEKMRKHPLYRAFRVDKLTLRAMETTLRIYLDPVKRLTEVPTLRMLRKPFDEIAEEASQLAAKLAHVPGIKADVEDDSSRLGSGSLPEQNIPTRVVSLKHTSVSAEELGSKLRGHNPPIFTRIQDDRVLIDPRTLLDGEAAEVEAAFRALFAQPK